MSAHLLKLELRLLVRERAVWVVLALFAAALAYGLWNGSRVARQHREMTTTLRQANDDFLGQVKQALGQQAIDPKSVAGRGSVAILPPAPLPLLAIGQTDLSPAHETVVLWRLNSPGESRVEIENPSHLLAGRFDLAFVLVWLYPLCLAALLYDLLAGDREAGTLRLALAQGISARRWMAFRAVARGLPVLALAALATLATGLFANFDGAFNRALLALAGVLAYGLFWVTLAMAVNCVASSAASAATALGAAWVVLVLVAPTLLNVAVESLHPTPSRPELVAAARKASGEAEKRGGELLNSFYRDHPELAPPGQQNDFAAQHLAVQTEVTRAIEPVRKKFDEQLARQQAVVARWRHISPTIVAHEALTDLAGTGYWRHRAFREQVNEFRKVVADFYAPKVHKRETLTMADYERLPRFTFREEAPGAWMSRVGAGLLAVLAAAGAFVLWTGWRLRPARISNCATLV